VDANRPSPASATPALVLASSSRYRRELLSRLGIAFEVLAPDIDESARPALEKARAVAALRPQAIVIGSDQTATIDGVVAIGKPGHHAAAVRQLREASGRTLTYHTAVALAVADTGFERCCVVDARVRFRQFDATTIETYLAREPAYDCAGAAKVEGLGITLIAALECEDPTALVGLPLIALTDLLALAGRPVP
jgi:septum formation protein